MKFRGLLFDLDGTLIDSRADLVTSVNLMLDELGYVTLPAAQIITFVGEGMRLLIERSLRASLSREPEEAEVLRALKVYAGKYREHLLDQTQTYPEVYETLAALAGWPKAVVTNKPQEFTLTILEALDLRRHFVAVIGGDTLPERKPAPEPLLAAARLCEVAPQDCLMIGDTKVDIQAGNAAGMKTCGYVGGFRGLNELVAANADFLIERFGELPKLVRGS
ncbi:MAG TPA: phosphoglycolate phosphatase [Blastocatellia bacterium]|nr:phosphoglycolate phosphatase [Blastocatellia bacterium]